MLLCSLTMKNQVIFVIFFLAFFQALVATRFKSPLLPRNTYPNAIKVNNIYYVVAFRHQDHLEIYSSTDLNSLKSIGTVFPQNETHPWAWQFQSAEIHKVDGSFYVYYEANKKTRIGETCIGVATSSTPGGPYKDLGQPLLEKSDYAYSCPTLARAGTP